MNYTVQSLSNSPKVPFNIDGRILFSNSKNEIIRLNLKPGEILDVHSNPLDVVFYVLKGKGVLEIENDIIVACEDMTIFVKAGVMRSWKNSFNDILTILVFKII